MQRRHRLLFVPIVAVASVVATACDDATTTQPGTEASTSTIRSQEQDRDRLQQAVAGVVSSCQERDRDRLRDLVQEQLRDRVLDMEMLGVCDGSALSATLEDLTIDGDTATVRVRLRISAKNGEVSELGEIWRFRWERERWVIAELPPAVTATTPSTVRVQTRDQTQNQDRNQR